MVARGLACTWLLYSLELVRPLVAHSLVRSDALSLVLIRMLRTGWANAVAPMETAFSERSSVLILPGRLRATLTTR